MTPAEHDDAAKELLRAEETGFQIPLLSQRYEMRMDDAYAVQNRILAAKIANGRRVVGWKIGLTSRAMQEALGIDIPDSGILFDDMDFLNGSTVPAGRFIQPRVEAEIAFVMKAPIAGDVDGEDVLAATAYVCPALEILDTRIVRKDADGNIRTVFDTISDNAANGGFVMGAPAVADDLRWIGAILKRDGIVEETGLGAGVLNNPVESVVWLARRMAEYDQTIEPGHVILSGSFIRPVECPAGAVIEADYGAFGSVSVSFE